MSVTRGLRDSPVRRASLAIRASLPATLLVAALVASMLAACGSEDVDAAVERPVEASLPSDGRGVDTSISVAAEPFAPTDEALALMQSASVELQEHSEWSYTIFIDLPAGRLASVTYTLDPTERDLSSLAPTNTPLYAYSRTSEITATRAWWRTEYVIPSSEFPPDAFAAARPGEPSAWLDHVVRAITRPHEASASDGTGRQVVVEALMTEAGLEVLSLTHGSVVATTTDAVLNLISAWDASTQHRQAMRRLARLRSCVENPGDSVAGRLRQQQYRDEPRAKQLDLDAIRSAEIDVMSNSGARFLGTFAAQASGLVRWLGFVTGPATAWADSRAASLIEERVRELERRIVDCEDEPGVWTGTLTYTRTSVRTEVRSHPGTSSGGRPTTDETHLEDERHWEQEWVLGPTIQQSGNTAQIEAQFHGQYRRTATSSREWSAWGSCPGEPTGGTIPSWGSTFESWHGEGSAQGLVDVSVTLEWGGPGTFVIGTTSVEIEVQEEWSRQEEKGGEACITSRSDSESGSSEDTWLMPEFWIEGQMDPNDPDRLVGSEETVEQIGNTTMTRRWTWDLRRE